MGKNDCIFCGIVSGRIKSQVIYEDEKVIAFPDIAPQAPVHILVIPREHYPGLNQTPEDTAGRLMEVARKIAADKGISESGYRLVINCNEDGGQAVGHTHLHLLGGRKMKWPPG